MDKRTITQHALAVVTFTVLAVVITYPAIRNMRSHIAGDGVDGIEYYSYFYSVKDNLLHGKPPLWPSDVYRYPLSVNTSLTDGRIFVLAGGLLSMVFPGVLVYNTLLLFFFVLNGYLSYVFYRLLTNDHGLGMLGGIMHGFSVWVIMNGYGAINVFLVFSLPAFGLVSLTVFRHGFTVKRIYLLYLSIYLLALSSAESFMLGIIGAAAGVLVASFTHRDRVVVLFQQAINAFSHVSSGFLILFMLLYLAFPFHIYQLLSGDFPHSGAFFAYTRFPLSALVIPPVNHYNSLLRLIAGRYGIHFPYISWWDETMYIGLPAILLFVFALFRSGRSRTLRFLAATSLFFLVVILSKNMFQQTEFPSLPAWLLLPVSYVLDHPEYFIMLFWFSASGAITLGLKYASANKTFIHTLIILLVAERMNYGYPAVDAAFLHGSSYAQTVSALPGKAVMDIPLDAYTGYNLLPYEYGKSIVGGMVHWYGDGVRERSYLSQPEVARFACGLDPWHTFTVYRISPFDSEESGALNDRLITMMKDLGINTVVVHKKWFYEDKCWLMREQAAALFQDLSGNESRIDAEVAEKIRSKAGSGGDNAVFRRVFSNDDVIVYQLP